MELTDKYVVIEYMDRNYPDSMKPDVFDLINKTWCFSYDGHSTSEILETLVNYIKSNFCEVMNDNLKNVYNGISDHDMFIQFTKEDIKNYDMLMSKCKAYGYVGDADA